MANTDIISDQDYRNLQNPSPKYTNLQNPLLANPNKPSISTLFVYSKNEPKIVKAAPFLAKAYYPDAIQAEITDIQNFSSVLSKYSTINTLVIYTHASGGSLILEDNPSVDHDSSTTEINKELSKAKVKITSKIVFEGCNIMRDPIDTCKMISSIAGPTAEVIGYSYYSIIQMIEKDFSRYKDLNAVKDILQSYDNRYWFPSLPAPQDVIGKKFLHGRRWFRKEYDETAPEGNNLKDIQSLSSLYKVKITNYKDAKKYKDNQDNSLNFGDIVTVTTISNVAKKYKIHNL